MVQIVGPKNNPDNKGLWIHQNAWLSMGIFDKGKEVEYKTKQEGNGVFAMVIGSEFTVAGRKLHRRDAVGITEADV